MATAAILAALDIYEHDGLFQRADSLSKLFEDAAHSLRGRPNVIDVRNIGLVAGIELAPREGAPGARAAEVFSRCFDRGILVRYTGDTLAFSPPLIIEESQIHELFDTVSEVLGEIA
jgi:beta-alanine--pyruvate transaminase